MTEQADGTRQAAHKPPLLARLGTWFGGAAGDRVAPPVRPKPSPAGTPAAGEAIPAFDPLAFAQALWGPGFAAPGGEQHVLDLVQPFTLDPAMSMLDISAGLGGAARVIANRFGVYVTGLERDLTIAQRGMVISVLQDMAKRAPVSVYDPESVELRAGAFDCILGRQATYAVRDKERLLRVLILSLKGRAQLLLTEFVADPKAGARPELAAWSGQLPRPPVLWTVEQYTDCLAGLGFEIRVTEDITATYRGLILSGWGQFLRTAALRKLPKPHLAAILGEVEFWLRTTAALESGALKVYRFYALASKAPARRA
jgi:methyltransferase family protein